MTAKKKLTMTNGDPVAQITDHDAAKQEIHDKFTAFTDRVEKQLAILVDGVTALNKNGVPRYAPETDVSGTEVVNAIKAALDPKPTGWQSIDWLNACSVPQDKPILARIGPADSSPIVVTYLPALNVFRSCETGSVIGRHFTQWAHIPE